jgi:hypothetical protein
MAQLRGRQTSVVHLGFVNRPSVSRNEGITRKFDEIGKLGLTGKLTLLSP